MRVGREVDGARVVYGIVKEVFGGRYILVVLLLANGSALHTQKNKLFA